ncbi:MAG TPA: M23 family metallopeptidase [Gemmatimonadales bacterium]|nr:M23 family metallopeptidase [Gemmatimonadales bacterium]
MAQRRWTLLVVPHGSGSSRSVQISTRALRVVGSIIGVVVIAAGVFAFTTVSKSVDVLHLQRLAEANRLLANELASTRQLVGQLTDTLDQISTRDRQVRLLAGLEPTSPDVQQAGIGGPVGAWPERDTLLAVAGAEGREAIDARVTVDALIRRADVLAASFGEAADSLRSYTDRLSRTPSIKPTAGFLSSPFAHERMNPILHVARPHLGIDLAAPLGTPIVAPAGGLVVDVATLTGYGKMVTIDHGYGVVTRYAHCSKILVRVGQRVKRDQEIALVGSTGLSTAPHLHYEVIVNGQHVNPEKYIFPDQIVE